MGKITWKEWFRGVCLAVVLLIIRLVFIPDQFAGIYWFVVLALVALALASIIYGGKS